MATAPAGRARRAHVGAPLGTRGTIRLRDTYIAAAHSERQRHHESSSRRRGHGRQRAAVLGGDMMCHREAEAEAGPAARRRGRAPQRDANIRGVFGRQEVAGVGDLDGAVVVRGAQAQLDTAVRRRAGECALDQLVQGVPETRGIACERRGLDLYVILEVDLFCLGERSPRFQLAPHQCDDVDGLQMKREVARGEFGRIADFADEPGLVFSRGKGAVSISVPIAWKRNRQQSVPDKIDDSIGDAAFADYVVLTGYSYTF